MDSTASLDPSKKRDFTIGHQCFAAIIVNMGGLVLGTVIGWSSPAESLVTEDIKTTKEEFALITSIMTLGAASSQIFIGLLMNHVSRKYLLIGMAAALAVGWFCMIFAFHPIFYYVSRFIIGFCSGSFCVTSPMYMAEVAHKHIRGRLGVLFQFMIVIGISIMFILGEFNNLLVLSIVPTLIPLIMIVFLVLLPESPVFCLKHGRDDEARKSLHYYRGKRYTRIESDIADMRAYAIRNEDTFWEVFKQRASLQALGILVVLHSIQQLCGINAILFYANGIFEEAASSLKPNHCSIILAVVQIVGTIVSTYLVDIIGRRILFVISLTILAVCNMCLSIFFLIDHMDQSIAHHIRWLPIVIVSLYMIGFSMGAGPLPWVMQSEMTAERIKPIVNPGVACLNWILAFAVTLSFKHLVSAIGSYSVFAIYGVMCVLGIVFVVMCVIETNDMTLEEIQVELAKKRRRRKDEVAQ